MNINSQQLMDMVTNLKPEEFKESLKILLTKSKNREMTVRTLKMLWVFATALNSPRPDHIATIDHCLEHFGVTK